MQVLPGKPVGDVEQIAGGPDHVEQHLLDVLALVVELVPLGLQQILDPVAEGSHDGCACLHISSIEDLDPGEVGEGGRDHVLQVPVLNFPLKVGHCKGLTVTKVGLGGRPENGAIRVSRKIAGPSCETCGSRRTRLDCRVTCCRPVPCKGTGCGWRTVEGLVLDRDVNDGNAHIGSWRQRVVSHTSSFPLVILVLNQRLLRLPLKGGRRLRGSARCTSCRCCWSRCGWRCSSWGSDRDPVLHLSGA